jgi:phosphoribosylanthranilate isomerase
MTFVKVCGITRAEDARHAVQHGATALGFVFWPGSPRYIDPARAAQIIETLPPGVTSVGVFVDQPVDEIEQIVERAGVGTIQLHGDETSAHAAALGRPVLKATTIAAAETMLADWPDDTLVLLDAHDPVRRGGTGQTIDWAGAADLAARRRVVLAGGLTPDNVQEAIAVVRPYGVDVSSGVEQSPGVKDLDKMSRFLEQVRTAGHGR